MENINLPPFYVGQKVEAIEDIVSRNGYGSVVRIYAKKGDHFPVLGLKKCCRWNVDIGLKQIDDSLCHGCKAPFDSGPVFCDARLFRVITENFQSITCKEVEAIESPLISVN